MASINANMNRKCWCGFSCFAWTRKGSRFDRKLNHVSNLTFPASTMSWTTGEGRRTTDFSNLLIKRPEPPQMIHENKVIWHSGLNANKKQNWNDVISLVLLQSGQEVDLTGNQVILVISYFRRVQSAEPQVKCTGTSITGRQYQVSKNKYEKQK